MKKLTFLLILLSINNSVFSQNSKSTNCATVNHKVKPVSSCNLSTNTSVDVIWKINCPDNKDIGNGLTIMVQFLNKSGKWNFPKTKSIPSGIGTIKINFSGLKFNTNQKIRYFAYPRGTNAEKTEITKNKLWREYEFDIPSCK